MKNAAAIRNHSVAAGTGVPLNGIDPRIIDLIHDASVRHASGLSEENLVALLHFCDRNGLPCGFVVVIRFRTASTIAALRLTGCFHAECKSECLDKAPVHKHITPGESLLGSMVGPPLGMVPSVLRVVVSAGIRSLAVELCVRRFFQITLFSCRNVEQLFLCFLNGHLIFLLLRG